MYELVFHNGRGIEYRKSKKLKDLDYVIEILDLIGMDYKLFYNCNRIHYLGVPLRHGLQGTTVDMF